jgi:hypothetical protein
MNAFFAAAPRLAREIAGLFFDDGSLALVVLAILATTAVLFSNTWFDDPEAMVFLVGAVTAALLENVARTSRAGPS